MRAIRESLVPVLVACTAEHGSHGQPIEDPFTAGLAVQYAPLDRASATVTRFDLPPLGLNHRVLRRVASDRLTEMSAGARLHGGPPAIMVSFHGIESSLVLVDEFWRSVAGRLAADLPGEIVVGIPARDVMVITGSQSPSGLAKARRCIDRVFFAGGPDLLTDNLLVWCDPGWDVFDPEAQVEVQDVGEWIPEDRKDNAREWIPEHLTEYVPASGNHTGVPSTVEEWTIQWSGPGQSRSIRARGSRYR